MSHAIFVNLPVADLKRSMAFWSALGFKFNAQFTDDTAASLIISEPSVYAMLLTHEKFAQFTDRKILDTRTHVEGLFALSATSRDEVNRIADAALKNGGSAAKPDQDYGFMFLRSFLDPDGHHWEILYMDPAHVQPA
jgi:predicted lactoylglutathione lyase